LSYLKHREEAPKTLNFAVVTISTSKYKVKKALDESGNLIVELLKQADYKVMFRKIIPDNPSMIRSLILKLSKSKKVDVIVTTGGTGITKSDLTVETITPLLQKEIPGFGEILRKLSFERIGSAAILTRAVAGVVDGKIVFCLPGSPDAVKVALEYLIIPEAPHLVKHARE